eukprot:gnl/TRDRNA2_/TRDRNA2_181698_c0_seq1.p1 gnl/TRDRNA2_/TRDRNA2_181698_c0~~gnl/TRDRNA2_/TRDRNA2_181698_c0_seq1.p1  ORF type:complete len:114 (+),score=17.06 gnl/TRDRNA2_/TRDRNA2_181698_c0_seq1:114-455(+)
MHRAIRKSQHTPFLHLYLMTGFKAAIAINTFRLRCRCSLKCKFASYLLFITNFAAAVTAPPTAPVAAPAPAPTPPAMAPTAAPPAAPATASFPICFAARATASLLAACSARKR